MGFFSRQPRKQTENAAPKIARSQHDELEFLMEVILNAGKDIPTRDLRSMDNFGDNAAKQLAKALESDDNLFRQRAVEALGITESDIAIEPLMGALHDPSWRVRVTAAEALDFFNRQSLIVNYTISSSFTLSISFSTSMV